MAILYEKGFDGQTHSAPSVAVKLLASILIADAGY